MKNRKLLRLALILCFLPVISHAAVTEQKLIEKATRASQVLTSVLKIEDKSIPLSLLDRAVCIAVIPDVIRIGFIFGARYGQGLVSCRVEQGWSEPSYMKILGGTWGLQVGVTSIDTILVFVNKNAVDRLSVNNFTLGGEASVAIGPIGRNAQAETDYELKSEIYSYSQSQGVFAGLTIGGASISIDQEANTLMYNNKVVVRNLLTNDGSKAPTALRNYVSVLETALQPATKK